MVHEMFEQFLEDGAPDLCCTSDIPAGDWVETPHGHCTQIMGSSAAREVGEKELDRRMYSEKNFFKSKPLRRH